MLNRGGAIPAFLFIVKSVIIFSIWYLFIGNRSLPEVVTGIILALLCTSITLCIRERNRSLRINWLKLCATAGTQTILDSLLLVKTLIFTTQGLHSRKGVLRFLNTDPGILDLNGENARALLVMTVSFAPNSYAVGIEDETGNIAVHQIEKRVIKISGVRDNAS